MVKVNHIAIQVKNKKDELFFTEILGMEKVGNFKIAPHLSEAIFKKKRTVEVTIFVKDNFKIELFITGRRVVPSFNHICLEIPDRKSFIERCKKYGIEIILVKRKGKESLFVRDFSGNLFEIKQVPSK